MIKFVRKFSGSEKMHDNSIQPVMGLKNFAGKMIDYAGIYPPASLSLSAAFKNYLTYRDGNYSWMLNKFIVPAGMLDELAKIAEELKFEGAVPLSIIGSGGETISRFNGAFKGDLKKISGFLKEHNGLFSADVFEVRLPVEITEQEEADDMLDLMISVSGELDPVYGKDTPVFYEAVLDEKFESTILKTVENIASLNNKCGYKLRTGGITPEAFPSPEQVAFAIMTCCEFDVPMKCTAGLHHPIRHFNKSVKSKMHGFLNVFTAGILAYTNDLDEMELLEIINDEEPEEFMFFDSGFEWNEIEITNAEIHEARLKMINSFGSCSFDEPVEDLKLMELIR